MRTSCTFFGRFIRSVIVILLVAFTSIVTGIVPANAATVVIPPGLTVNTTPGASGKGVLSLDAPGLGDFTVNLSIISGAFANGQTTTAVGVVDGSATTLAYSCTVGTATISVGVVGKATVPTSIAAPCGAVVVVPPTPVWNQTATITPGAAGSGDFSVLFNNANGTTAVGNFYITVNAGPPIEHRFVAAGLVQPAFFHGVAKPGDVIRVFGTKDGTVVPGILLTDPPVTLPSAPPPAPVWNQTASVTLGAAGSGNATVSLSNVGSTLAGGYFVTVNDGPRKYITSVAANGTGSIAVHEVPGAIIRVFGTKDGTGVPVPLTQPIKLREAPAPPAPVWKQTASITLGKAGSGNASVSISNIGSNRAGGFFVTVNDGPRKYVTSVAAGVKPTLPIAIHEAPGAVIRVYGARDGAGVPTLLAGPVPLPKAVVVPPAPHKPVPHKPTPTPQKPHPAPVVKPKPTVPVKKPVVPVKTPVKTVHPVAPTKKPAAVVKSQAVTKQGASGYKTWKPMTFNTAASTPAKGIVVSPVTLIALGSAVVAAGYFVVLLFRRRRA